jgi:hypothetical protein
MPRDPHDHAREKQEWEKRVADKRPNYVEQ